MGIFLRRCWLRKEGADDAPCFPYRCACRQPDDVGALGMLVRAKRLMLIASAAIFFVGGWVVNDWRLTGQMADLKREYAEQALAMADAAKQIGIEANNAISAADARAWKGLEDDKKELDRLRGCVAAGTCGVRLIKKYVPTDGGASDSSTSSVGHDTIELDTDVQRRVLDLREAIEEDRRKIEYLQEYAREVWEALQKASAK